MKLSEGLRSFLPRLGRGVWGTLGRMSRPLLSAAGLIAAGLAVGLVLGRDAPSAKEALTCRGEYTDSLELGTAAVSAPGAGEGNPSSPYTFLVRSSAKYECPYFGSDGKLRRRKLDAVEHATAFAYEQQPNGETFLLTNEHLVDWPDVTAPGHRVDGVQEGCKRVELRLRIVHDDKDDDESTQVPLSLVTTDPYLDAAILKAAQKLPVLPYAIGRSAGLRQGNAVQVRGFPLGLIYAVNTGKVVNAYDRDLEQGWDHVDFVIDALLSEGNSGSPVLAQSCRTGRLELVGMYHAGYKGHSALNVVVAIDQLRELMAKKRRTPHVASDGPAATFGPAAQARLRSELGAGALPLFTFGDVFVMVEPLPERFRYHVYGRQFPVDDRRALVLEDELGADGVPTLRRLWVRGPGGLRPWDSGALGADEQELLTRVGAALRNQLLHTLEHRAALAAGDKPDARRRAREELRTLERVAGSNRELLGSLLELTERLAPNPEAPLQRPADAPPAVALPVPPLDIAPAPPPVPRRAPPAAHAGR